MNPSVTEAAVDSRKRRWSSRLVEAKKQRNKLLLLNDDNDNDAAYYRPKATGSALQQDCGILPSE